MENIRRRVLTWLRRKDQDRINIDPQESNELAAPIDLFGSDLKRWQEFHQNLNKVNNLLLDSGLTKLSIIEYEDTQLIGAISREVVLDEFSDEMGEFITYVSAFPPTYIKNGGCRLQSEELIEKFSFDERYKIKPTTTDNIRNSLYEHYVTGKTCMGGYMIVDGTQPALSPKLREISYPEGFIILGKDAEECIQIAELVYGGDLTPAPAKYG